MAYCTECGIQNPDDARWCIECGTELPILNAPPRESNFSSRSAGVETARQPPISSRVSPTGSGSMSWWQRLGPDWKAALLVYLGWLIMESLVTVTGGAGCLFSYPILALIGLGQGVLVMYYASRDNRYTSADCVRLGARSALWTVIVTKVGAVLVAVLFSGITLGMALATLPIVLVAQLGGTVIQTVAIILGSWLSGQYRGKKLISILVGVGCSAAVIVGILTAILTVVLGVLGISLLQQ